MKVQNSHQHQNKDFDTSGKYHSTYCVSLYWRSHRCADDFEEDEKGEEKAIESERRKKLDNAEFDPNCNFLSMYLSYISRKKLPNPPNACSSKKPELCCEA